MPYTNRESLGPLLESEDQIHLTMYLANHGDLSNLRNQLRVCLAESREFLELELQPEEMKALLRPIELLLKDNSTLKTLKGNIGIFRTCSTFRILSFPVEVTRSSHVASTFHVKPLLRWMQWKCEFLLVGIDKTAISLYYGSEASLRKLDGISYPKSLVSLLEKADPLSLSEMIELERESKDTFARVSEWIGELAPKPGLKAFVAGSTPMIERYMAFQTYRRTSQTPVAHFFSEEVVHEIAVKIRNLFKAQTRKALERVLHEFHLAKEMNCAEKNMRIIAKAAVQGGVKKLLIAENREIFGTFDRKTGEIRFHPFDLNHEDDDLLDDLAQKVLKSGGEVYLAKKEDIPEGRPILAILENTGPLNQIHRMDDHSSRDTHTTPGLRYTQ